MLMRQCRNKLPIEQVNEFPKKRRTAQNLVNNASHFAKEEWAGEIVRNQTAETQKNTKWNA